MEDDATGVDNPPKRICRRALDALFQRTRQASEHLFQFVAVEPTARDFRSQLIELRARRFDHVQPTVRSHERSHLGHPEQLIDRGQSAVYFGLGNSCHIAPLQSTEHRPAAIFASQGNAQKGNGGSVCESNTPETG